MGSPPAAGHNGGRPAAPIRHESRSVHDFARPGRRARAGGRLSMITLTTPGVYVEETPPGPRIERVDTATAAFVGPTRRGPLGVRPRLLHSAADFERLYGGCQPLRFIGGTAHAEPRTHHVAHAVRAFFANGGARLYVARTAFGARPASAVLGEDETPDRRVTLHALDPGSGGNGRVVLRERLLPAGLRAMTEAPPGTLLRTVSAGRP